MKKPFLILIGISLSFFANAQEQEEYKFKPVSIEIFKTRVDNIDTSYGAVYLADIGSSSFEGNTKGWFNLIYKRHCLIKIYNKKGFDLGKVEIPLYISSNNDGKEWIENIKASTFNLVDGKVVETKLGKEAVLTEKEDKNHILKKFALSDLREGSILEYSYTVKSDFVFNLQPWAFQGNYPKVWSEYSVNIPSFFEYEYILRGFIPLTNSNKTKATGYIVSENPQALGAQDQVYTIQSMNTINRWLAKNVPVFKEENYTYSENNYISEIEFQLISERFGEAPAKNFLETWPTFAQHLLKQEDFGESLSFENNWASEDLAKIIGNSSNETIQAKKIYEWVRDHIKDLGAKGVYLTQPLKNVFKSRQGYSNEINMLLIALLKQKNIDAKPVLLSTRGHGFINPKYPLITRFNYVIAQVKTDSSTFLLDATEPYLAFGKLPLYCYNGPGILIDTSGKFVSISPESASETKITGLVLRNKPGKPGNWVGNLTALPGYFESSKIRENLTTKGPDYLKKSIESSIPREFIADSLVLENEKNLDKSLNYKTRISINSTESNPSIIYFNPIVQLNGNYNPFKSVQRKYPVELPYKSDDIYNFELEIPKGYIADELPKSVKVALEGNEAYFEYFATQESEKILLRSRVKLNKTIFPSEDYESLRKFFDLIVKKYSEQIVLKKL